MKKVYRIDYRKFINLEALYMFHETLVLFITCSKCGSKNEKISK